VSPDHCPSGGIEQCELRGPAVLLVADRAAPVGTVEAVRRRALAEGGWLIAQVVSGDAATPARIREVVRTAEEAGSGLVVLDAGWLTVATVYGDLVADPRDEAALLLDDMGSLVGARFPSTRLPAASRWEERSTAELLAHAGDELRASNALRTLRPGTFPGVHVHKDLEAALAEVDGVDEAALRLRRASRADDGFLSTFLVRPVSRQLTRRLVRTSVTPARITAVSLVLGLASAVAYGGGHRPWLVAGSFLLAASLVVDCVDGEVARYTRTSSALGGWLDVGSDRVKEYAVYAGLAVGAAAARGQELWGLAIAAMALLVARHFVDFGFAARATPETGAGPAARLSAATSRRTGLVWVKRAIIMPVGERTILVIVLVPIFGAAVALAALLLWGALAAGYTTAGRLARAWSASAVEPRSVAHQRLVAQCDARPFLGWPAEGRVGWLWPALLRVVEIALIVAVCLLVDGAALLAVAYTLSAVVAFRGYDIVYRQRLGEALSTEDRLRGVGWPIRVFAVAAAAFVSAAMGGPASAEVVLLVLAACWAISALVVNGAWWRAYCLHRAPQEAAVSGA